MRKKDESEIEHSARRLTRPVEITAVVVVASCFSSGGAHRIASLKSLLAVIVGLTIVAAWFLLVAAVFDESGDDGAQLGRAPDAVVAVAERLLELVQANVRVVVGGVDLNGDCDSARLECPP